MQIEYNFNDTCVLNYTIIFVNSKYIFNCPETGDLELLKKKYYNDALKEAAQLSLLDLYGG